MKKVEVLVRAIIQIQGKILVCRKIGKDYYFFPGGHVDFGESARGREFSHKKGGLFPRPQDWKPIITNNLSKRLFFYLT